MCCFAHRCRCFFCIIDTIQLQLEKFRSIKLLQNEKKKRKKRKKIRSVELMLFLFLLLPLQSHRCFRFSASLVDRNVCSRVVTLLKQQLQYRVFSPISLASIVDCSFKLFGWFCASFSFSFYLNSKTPSELIPA